MTISSQDKSITRASEIKLYGVFCHLVKKWLSKTPITIRTLKLRNLAIVAYVAARFPPIVKIPNYIKGNTSPYGYWEISESASGREQGIMVNERFSNQCQEEQKNSCKRPLAIRAVTP